MQMTQTKSRECALLSGTYGLVLAPSASPGQFLAIKHLAITIAVDANLIQIGLGRLGSGGLMILKAYPWVH